MVCLMDVLCISGAPVEGWSWEHIADEQQHFQHMASGRYTDDTQMTLVLAKSLVSSILCM